MDDDLPAWSMRPETALVEAVQLTGPITREWAWGGSSGSGVRVGIIDSGVDADHPDVAGVGEAVVVRAGEDGRPVADADNEPDVSGHGTACAAIIRSLAPQCELVSVRVLGPDFTGSGRDLVAGLLWALQNRCQVVNLSLATTRKEFASPLQELVDDAYFNNAIVVASAHNMPVLSWPWRFAAVVSVASHDRPDGYEFHYNPEPPVEFYARGADLDVAWPGGGHIRVTGNSFATPHISAFCALILAKHPGLTPFQVKSTLYATATNVVCQ
jgi:subtilisin family serine protease